MSVVDDQQYPQGEGVGVEPGTARGTVNRMVEAGLLDQLMSQVGSGELALTG
jgi:hypothetical protein